jgi:S1-C subfamily serine protease
VTDEQRSQGERIGVQMASGIPARRLRLAAASAGILGLGLAALVLPALADGPSRKEIVRATMPAVVMVLAVDKRGEQLRPISGGSGTIVGRDGSVLTNHHVVFDPRSGAPHQLFVIGRFRAADREPELVCAGHPARGRLNPDLDLALIKCDLDMDMRAHSPSGWPTLPVGRSEDIVPGEQILVLGYPGVGGNTIQVTQGLLSGWMGESRGASRAYMKTDADITHGNSGGTAIDELGNLVGVPTAFRVTTAQQGDVVVTAGKVGLIRPIEHARELLAVAATGWTPTEGPGTITSPGPAPPDRDDGVVIATRVVDAANRQPVAAAVLIVFKAGVAASDVDLENLDDQALSWGHSDAGGEVTLATPIPRGGAHTAAVLARGYRPLLVDRALVVREDAPQRFDPWGMIRIQRR